MYGGEWGLEDMRKVTGGGMPNGARATTNGVQVTATALRPGALTFLLTIFAALVAAFAFSGAAAAAVDQGTPAPAISSDKADYAPGELVTLHGSNWAPGEVVTVDVNDDQGTTWRRTVNVTANASGEITDQFNLPDWFVATYAVIATGPLSGTATTSFTDSVMAKASVDVRVGYVNTTGN